MHVAGCQMSAILLCHLSKKSVIFQPYNGSTPNHIIPFCYFLFLWAFTCVLWMLEVNQVFSNLGITQSEINVNPQSTLPGLVPRLIMLSSPWVSDAKFGVSNWSAAEMRQKSSTVWSLSVDFKSVSEQKKIDSAAMSKIRVALKGEQQKPGELVLQ